MKPKSSKRTGKLIPQHIIDSTRPDYFNWNSAMGYFFSEKEERKLLKSTYDCGNNGRGYVMMGRFKKIGQKIACVLTPGIMNQEGDNTSFEFTASTNLTSMRWMP